MTASNLSQLLHDKIEVPFITVQAGIITKLQDDFDSVGDAPGEFLS